MQYMLFYTLQVCLGDISRTEYVRRPRNFKPLLHIPWRAVLLMVVLASITKGSEDLVLLRLFSMTQNSAYLCSGE